MHIDDVTLAKAIAARFAPPTTNGDRSPEDALWWFGREVGKFVRDNHRGPYRYDDDLTKSVRARFGRPAGEDWQLADWARKMQARMDELENLALGTWIAQDIQPDRTGFGRPEEWTGE